MTPYDRTIKFLYSLQTSGMKFGLRGIRSLLRELGNPHTSFPAIHIAGTNGKGSTAALLASILTAAGYKTGLYTSPHVVDFTERIRINGAPIPRRDVIAHSRVLTPLVKRFRTTFFETVTAMAFRHFAKEQVDIAVIETGLGGRLDATNVLRPIVSAITTIGLEHTDILGTTIEQIAFEKAGIIKIGVPCVTGVRSAPALRILREIARKRNAPFITAKAKTRLRGSTIKGSRFDIQIQRASYRDLFLGLAGEHQVQNAAIALLVIQVLTARTSFKVSEQAVRSGLSRVQTLAGIPARLALLQSHPPIIADVAHNPDALRVLVKSLEGLRIGNVVLVFGVSKDKDSLTMIHLLKRIVDIAVVVAARTERALDVATLHRSFGQAGIPTVPELSVRKGVERARRLARRRQHILITGSHFVVGEAMAFLNRKNYLTISQ